MKYKTSILSPIMGGFMAIKISEHFTFKKLFRFVFPSIIMMVFTSVYGIVDGFFVSNFAGDTAFASVNFIMPFIMGLSAIGFMMGTGGSALVAFRFGEGKDKKANQTFSLLVYTMIIMGVGITILGQLLIEPVTYWLGATEEMAPHCILYGRISFLSLTFFILQNMFQSFLVTAEKPKLGLAVTITAGVTNMVLDALLVGVLDFGVAGAASATAISETIGGVVPLIYFILPNKSRLRLGKPTLDFRAIVKASSNGASEFMTTTSMSIVNMLYNFQLMRFAGEQGVASYGVIMYVNFVFVSVFIGYSIGVSPIISYNHGSKNSFELKNMFKKSMIIITSCVLIMEICAQLLAGTFAKVFVGYSQELCNMTQHAFSLYSISFLFMGFNVFGSGFFTALNNGVVSAVISFSRSCVFQIVMVLALPLFLQLDGVWLSDVAAEAISLIVTATFIISNRKKYNYF